MAKWQTREPGPDDAARWRDLADLVMLLAHGRSHDWREARRLCRLADGCNVFGQAGPDNPCTLLRRVTETAAIAASVHDHTHDMNLHATEVLRRYRGWYALRAAERRP